MAEKSPLDQEGFPFLSTSIYPEEEAALPVESDANKRKRNHQWRIIVVSICVGVVLASVAWASALLKMLDGGGHHQQREVQAPALVQKTDCGSSHEEAVANNCSFQLWSYSWVPADCFDNELHDEFLALQAKEHWGYFSDLQIPPHVDLHQDHSMFVQVPLEEARSGTRNDLHSTWGQHYWHCAYYMRRFFRQVDRSVGDKASELILTNRDVDKEHIEHCQQWVADPSLYRWDDVRIKLKVGYNKCLSWK